MITAAKNMRVAEHQVQRGGKEGEGREEREGWRRIGEDFIDHQWPRGRISLIITTAARAHVWESTAWNPTARSRSAMRSARPRPWTSAAI
jgi:hypothetical protein